MLKEEFLKLTGMSDINDEEFTRLNVIYEELPDIDEQQFCKMFTSRDFDKLLKWSFDLALAHRGLDSMRNAWKSDAWKIAKKVILEDYEGARGTAYEILGTANTIKFKLQNGMKLNESDYRYIEEIWNSS